MSAMMQLYMVESAQTATFGGGAGLAVVSPFRIVSSSVSTKEPIGLPFEKAHEKMLRHYANCRVLPGMADFQREHQNETYRRLLAGEVVQTTGGKVQILPA